MAKRRRGTVTNTTTGIPSSYKPTAPTPSGSGLGGTGVNAPISQPVVNGVPYAPAVPPPDPTLEAQRITGLRNVALGNAYAGFQLGQIENEYGLGGDTSNPFAQSVLLADRFKRSQRGTTNSYASAGQLYSGAYGRAQGENTRNYEMGYDDLSRRYSAAKQNVGFGQLQAYANAGTSIDQATFDSLLRALSR